MPLIRLLALNTVALVGLAEKSGGIIEMSTAVGIPLLTSPGGGNPDGQRAVSASLDQTLKVWDLESGEVIATFTC